MRSIGRHADAPQNNRLLEATACHIPITVKPYLSTGPQIIPSQFIISLLIFFALCFDPVPERPLAFRRGLHLEPLGAVAAQEYLEIFIPADSRAKDL